MGRAEFSKVSLVDLRIKLTSRFTYFGTSEHQPQVEMRKELGSSNYGPTNTNPNVVESVGRQGYHHLGLPQLSVGLGATPGNRETKHQAYSLDYYSSFAKTRALDASGNPINNLK